MLSGFVDWPGLPTIDILQLAAMTIPVYSLTSVRSSHLKRFDVLPSLLVHPSSRKARDVKVHCLVLPVLPVQNVRLMGEISLAI